MKMLWLVGVLVALACADATAPVAQSCSTPGRCDEDAISASEYAISWQASEYAISW